MEGLLLNAETGFPPHARISDCKDLTPFAKCDSICECHLVKEESLFC